MFKDQPRILHLNWLQQFYTIIHRWQHHNFLKSISIFFFIRDYMFKIRFKDFIEEFHSMKASLFLNIK